MILMIMLRGAKYHGKMVRLRRDSETPTAVVGSINETRRVNDRKKLINLVSQEAEIFKKVTDSMRNAVSGRQTITQEMVNELVRSTKSSGKRIENHMADSNLQPLPKSDCYEMKSSSTTSLLKVNIGSLPPIVERKGNSYHSAPINNNNSSNSITDINIPLKGNYRREFNRSDRSFSLMKWSDEELSRMSSIYNEMNQPKQKNSVNLWALYLESFSARFRAFFPGRSEEEVIEKAREMISKRRLKERGEPLFWKEVASTMLANKSLS